MVAFKVNEAGATFSRLADEAVPVQQPLLMTRKRNLAALINAVDWT